MRLEIKNLSKAITIRNINRLKNISKELDKIVDADEANRDEILMMVECLKAEVDIMVKKEENIYE